MTTFLDKITIKVQELFHETAVLERTSCVSLNERMLVYDYTNKNEECFDCPGIIHERVGFMMLINIYKGEARAICYSGRCIGGSRTFDFIPPLPIVSPEQLKLIYALESEYFLKPPGVDPRPVFSSGGPWVITQGDWENLNENLKNASSQV